MKISDIFYSIARILATAGIALLAYGVFSRSSAAIPPLPIDNRYIQWPTNMSSHYRSVDSQYIPGGVPMEEYSSRLTEQTYMSMIGTMDAWYQRALAASCFGTSETLMLTNTNGSVNDGLEYSPGMAYSGWTEDQKGFYLGLHGPWRITNNIDRVITGTNSWNSYLYVTNWVKDDYSSLYTRRMPSFMPIQLNNIWCSERLPPDWIEPRFSAATTYSSQIQREGGINLWAYPQNFAFCLLDDWCKNLSHTYIRQENGRRRLGRSFEGFFYGCSTSHFKDGENTFYVEDTDWVEDPFDFFGGSEEVVTEDEWGNVFTNKVFKEIKPAFTFFGDMTHFVGLIDKSKAVDPDYQMWQNDPAVNFFSSDKTSDVWMGYQHATDFQNQFNEIKWTNIVKNVVTNIDIREIIFETYETNYTEVTTYDYPLTHVFTNEVEEAYGWKINSYLPPRLGSRLWLEPWVYENTFMSCLDTFIIGPNAFPQPCFSNEWDGAHKDIDFNVDSHGDVVWEMLPGTAYWTVVSNSAGSAGYTIDSEFVQTNNWTYIGNISTYMDVIAVDGANLVADFYNTSTNDQINLVIAADNPWSSYYGSVMYGVEYEVWYCYVDLINHVLITRIYDGALGECDIAVPFYPQPIVTDGIRGSATAGWGLRRQRSRLKRIDYKSPMRNGLPAMSWPMMYPGEPLHDDGFEKLEYTTFSSISYNPASTPSVPNYYWDGNPTQQIFRLRGNVGYSASQISQKFSSSIWLDEISKCTQLQRDTAGWTASATEASSEVIDDVYNKDKAIQAFNNLWKHLNSEDVEITGDIVFYPVWKTTVRFEYPQPGEEWRDKRYAYVTSPAYGGTVYTNTIPLVRTLQTLIHFRDDTIISNGQAQAGWSSIGAAKFKFSKMGFSEE